jgi:hypothetical protein
MNLRIVTLCARGAVVGFPLASITELAGRLPGARPRPPTLPRLGIRECVTHHHLRSRRTSLRPSSPSLEVGPGPAAPRTFSPRVVLGFAESSHQPSRLHARCAIASSRRIRSSIGGWVENRRLNPPPLSGLTMKRCAVAGVSRGMRSLAASCSTRRAGPSRDFPPKGN